jgi:hypothetical protein
MKVFISWSGPHSKKLAEALRDWLPGVIQLVTPYFTPSDIEKGASWSTDISKELSDSKIGILCITRENIHSDWILFEAGALSKSMEKSHVCPILFGITNTDLAGPLKQFQTTEFEKKDMHRLMGVINSSLGDQKLPQKTLDNVFDKWWPDLAEKINKILDEVEKPKEPVRDDREILDEILQLSRLISKSPVRGKNISPAAVENLLKNYIQLHNEQAHGRGDFQETLDMLQKMDKAVRHISTNIHHPSEELDELLNKFHALDYTYQDYD